MSDVRKNSVAAVKYEIGTTVIRNLMFIIFGLLSLTGIAFLSSIIFSRENAIYFIYGAKSLWIMGIQWFKYGVIFLLSTKLAFFYTMCTDKWVVYVQTDTFIYSWVLCALSCTAAIFWGSRTQFSEQPIEMLKRWI
jgi:hypothetical protein